MAINKIRHQIKEKHLFEILKIYFALFTITTNSSAILAGYLPGVESDQVELRGIEIPADHFHTKLTINLRQSDF